MVKGVLLELRLLAKTVPEYNEPAPLIGHRRAARFGCTLVMLLWTPASASAASAVSRAVLELFFCSALPPSGARVWARPGRTRLEGRWLFPRLPSAGSV